MSVPINISTFTLPPTISSSPILDSASFIPTPSIDYTTFKPSSIDQSVSSIEPSPSFILPIFSGINSTLNPVPSSQTSIDHIISTSNHTENFSTTLIPSTKNPIVSPEDFEPYRQFMVGSRHWVQRVFVPVVLIIGLLGNTATILVLTRPRMRSSTNTYLTALSISDLLYLLSVFSLSLQHHPHMRDPKHWLYWYYCKYAYWIADASSKLINFLYLPKSFVNQYDIISIHILIFLFYLELKFLHVVMVM